MDDMGMEHDKLGHFLKVWADHYGCSLEVKGGAIPSNFSKFIVTSQYLPEDIWFD